MSAWCLLLNSDRRRPTSSQQSSLAVGHEVRTEIERDFDRVLFSSPVRRLADKTQVFPLEKNDSVRTRLTHSHEVANLARAIGIDLAFNHGIAADTPQPQRDVPALLATIGLAHDIGNPPFGHQGEAAIQNWFHDNQARVFGGHDELTEAMRRDFLQFEGNAQALRLLTQLQVINDTYGLNLTHASLAALMKYTVPSDAVSRDRVEARKPGFFQSEQGIVQDVWAATGLSDGRRHPLTYIMEACDDIAYSVLDVEDAVKKRLVSYHDVVAWLEHHAGDDPLTRRVVNQAQLAHREYRDENLSPAELNDISMQVFRIRAIGALIGAVTHTFLDHRRAIEQGTFGHELLKRSEAARFIEALKQFNLRHAYKHKSVLEVELTGFRVIHDLMDLFWEAITCRENDEHPGSPRLTPFATYAYGRISENYRRVFESPLNPMPVRYREMQLLTDMISGMTDTYALSLCDELQAARQGFR